MRLFLEFLNLNSELATLNVHFFFVEQFGNFFTTPILREINLSIPEVLKIAILTFSVALKLDFDDSSAKTQI